MIIVKRETYVCEICGNEFDEEYDCIKCERSHVIDFTDRINDEIIQYLKLVEQSVDDYRVGEKVMRLEQVKKLNEKDVTLFEALEILKNTNEDFRKTLKTYIEVYECL